VGKRVSGFDVLQSLPIHEDARDERRPGSLRGAIAEVSLEGDYAQFGVYRGRTARMILDLMSPGRKLHLFDSFEGLPEDWTRKQKMGAFRLDNEEIPNFDPDRVIMHKGWFKDTIPGWAGQSTLPLAFIHLDADLYSSTVDVLFNIDSLILKGTIILFDEYAGRKQDDEHRALLAWAEKFNRSYQYLWRSSGPQVCIRIQ
jgi:hypothetical protein